MPTKVTLNSQQLEALEEHVSDVGGEMCSYSGRAMYGEECLGITLDDTADAFRLALLIDRDDLAMTLMSPKFDSMGKGIIIYFPEVIAPEGLDEDDED